MISEAIREKVLSVGKRLAQQAINYAAGIPGNVSGQQREEVAAEYLLDRVSHEVEAVDQFIPVIGAYMDLPVVDALEYEAEKAICRLFIHQVYVSNELKAEQAA